MSEKNWESLTLSQVFKIQFFAVIWQNAAGSCCPTTCFFCNLVSRMITEYRRGKSCRLSVALS